MTMNPSSHSCDIEKQCPQHPNRFHHLFLATMGWYVLGPIDVKEFLHKAEKDDSYWEKHNKRFCEAAGQITTAQGLVLGVCATFLTSTPPVEGVNYISSDCYSMCSTAFLLSIGGLIFQLLFFQASQALSQVHNPEPEMLNDYIELFCLPQYTLLSSLVFLAIGFMRALLGSSFLAYVELAVPITLVLLAIFFTRVKLGMITLTRRIAYITLISMIIMICSVGYKSTSW